MAFNLSNWLFRKRLETKAVLNQASVSSHRVGNPYHAVSVMPGNGACEQARLMKDKRFLSAEAPPLPLDLCNASSCSCRYRHHDDRRYQVRREQDQGLPGRDRHRGERRFGRGRRVTDV